MSPSRNDAAAPRPDPPPVRRREPPSLRLRLLGGLGILLFLILFTVLVLVFVGFQLRLDPDTLSGLILFLIVGDVLIFLAFAGYRLRLLVLNPAARMVEGAERIAQGDHEHRLPDADTAELARLSTAVNAMAASLLRSQAELAENIRSLDATNRELTEARTRLVRAEKLASIGRLAAGVAHEIGNPLGAIIGYVEVGRRRGADGEWVEGIAYETRRIDRIVRGLLDYARPKAAAGRPVRLGDTVRRTVEMMEVQGRFRHVDVELSLAADLPDVLGDAGQIEQVLVNLLLNAADAIGEPEGRGRISVSTSLVRVGPDQEGIPRRRREDPAGVDYAHLRRLERTADPGPESRLGEGDAAAELRVADDGPGIPVELRARVFEPFFTTKDPGRGTGLGLAVSARLIEGMGGAIEALSGEEGGAVFRVLLPVAERKTGP